MYIRNSLANHNITLNQVSQLHNCNYQLNSVSLDCNLGVYYHPRYNNNVCRLTKLLAAYFSSTATSPISKGCTFNTSRGLLDYLEESLFFLNAQLLTDQCPTSCRDISILNHLMIGDQGRPYHGHLQPIQVSRRNYYYS